MVSFLTHLTRSLSTTTLPLPPLQPSINSLLPFLLNKHIYQLIYQPNNPFLSFLTHVLRSLSTTTLHLPLLTPSNAPLSFFLIKHSTLSLLIKSITFSISYNIYSSSTTFHQLSSSFPHQLTPLQLIYQPNNSILSFLQHLFLLKHLFPLQHSLLSPRQPPVAPCPWRVGAVCGGGL